MINDRRVRADLAEALNRIREVSPGGRRVPPEELQRVLGERCNLSAYRGAMAFAEPGREPYPNPNVGSASQIHDAEILDQSTPGSLSWFTEEVEEEPARYVCFVFSLAMGNGSGIPEPSVTFALDLEGREIARFCLVKGARQWTGEGGLFAFFPLAIRSLPYGGIFEVDTLLHGESTLSDGYGVVVVDRELVSPGRANTMTIRALSEHPSRHWARVGLASEWFPMFYAESHMDAIRASVKPRATRRTAPTTSCSVTCTATPVKAASSRTRRREWGPRSRAGSDRGRPCSATPATSPDSTSSASPSTTGRWTTTTGRTCSPSTTSSSRHVRHRSRLRVDLRTSTGTATSTSVPNAGSACYYSADPRLPYGDCMQGERASPADLWAHLRGDGVPAITVPHHMSAAQLPLDLRDFRRPRLRSGRGDLLRLGDSFEHGQPVTSVPPRIERLEWVRTSARAIAPDSSGPPTVTTATPEMLRGRRRGHIFHHLGSGRAGVRRRGASRDRASSMRCTSAVRSPAPVTGCRCGRRSTTTDGARPSGRGGAARLPAGA